VAVVDLQVAVEDLLPAGHLLVAVVDLLNRVDLPYLVVLVRYPCLVAVVHLWPLVVPLPREIARQWTYFPRIERVARVDQFDSADFGFAGL
jgi:hypothetical protein